MRPEINKVKTVIKSWSLVTFKLHNSDSRSVKVGKPKAVGLPAYCISLSRFLQKIIDYGKHYLEILILFTVSSPLESTPKVSASLDLISLFVIILCLFSPVIELMRHPHRPLLHLHML